MKRALFIDLSIPLAQDSIYLSRYGSFIKSIVKAISKTSKIKYYLTLPLETFDILHKDVFSQLRVELTRLIQEDRLSIVLKPNYEVSYPKLSSDTLFFDTSMSEHLLAYLFGEKKSFEGDNALVINNFSYFYMNNNDITYSSLSDLSDLGFTYILSEVESPFRNKSIKVLPLNTEINSLFRDVVNTEVVSNFIVNTSSADYSIWKLNLLDIFSLDEKVALINIENLLYLLDKNTDLDWTMVEEVEEVIKYTDMELSSDSELFTKVRASKNLPPLQRIQKTMSNYFISQDSSKLEDALWSVPFFLRTSFQEIDDVNRFNHLLLIVLSSSIKDDNLYSNPEFVKYISSKIEELSDLGMKVSSSEFVSVLKEFQSQINKIVFN